jgi:hypothetical protein
MMPKQNPKHQRKTVLYERQHELQARAKFPKRYLVMGIILACSIIGIVVLFVVLNPDNPIDKSLSVEEFDKVDVNYKMWANKNKDPLVFVIYRPSGPDDENENFVFNVSKSNVIAGFYFNILGLNKGESDYFALPANIDNDNNGFDDNTGDEVLSYGANNSQFFNTPLIFWVRINNITKHSSQPNSSEVGPSESLLLSWLHRNIITSLFIFNFQSIL